MCFSRKRHLLQITVDRLKRVTVEKNFINIIINKKNHRNLGKKLELFLHIEFSEFFRVWKY